MGYYTCYEMTAKRVVDEAQAQSIKNCLEELGVLHYALHIEPDICCNVCGEVHFSSSDAVKWYGHDLDMLECSKKFPEVLFCLHGEGEDSNDKWDAYYLNGKMQHCQAEITYPPFDESKLR